ncbi:MULTISPECIES: LacI family DNA-binding transcriptional regulator [unclassified Micromonospora]|uniref:LacI family DNA-binding transcriptional regulator n=1 Tax=unclassified Micromonospora TaxID=2617518 RepID=UPI0036271C8A
MSAQPVRLIDVAAAANVSTATASQVMNGTGRVAESTRRRVLDAARTLRYRPNALARSVASGRSNTVGVLAENAAGAFCMPVLIGINRCLSSHDLASLLYDAAHDPDLRREHIAHMLARQVDGIILIGEGPDVPIAGLDVDFGGPVVCAFGPPGGPGVTQVSTNERAGGALAAQRLIAMGRTRIAHVTAADTLTSVRERLRGFSQALDAAGLQPAAVLHGEFTRSWGQRAATRLLAEVDDADAVFAGNDAIAIGLAAQLEALGRRVPDDIAVVGYDNLAGYGDDVAAYLESVDPRLMEVGQRSAETLVDRLRGGEAAAQVNVDPTLAPGATTRGDSLRQRQELLQAFLRSVTAPPVATLPDPPRARRTRR